ncbi:hypothetical protein NEIFLAOT_02216 [Neisseria flavescens NRL30031/H210]|uniref:Uncharacterized protein n=1 Tax=Neisseria flavescens NRL30031/H210 TaxID=546264 RepID=C0EQG1_NEIFL|nr:hypothetical protein NEIFLAOT_02216 [Neisseria flavescens NRL30031/H210]
MPWHLGQNNKSKGRLKIDSIVFQMAFYVEYMMKPSSYASRKKRQKRHQAHYQCVWLFQRRTGCRISL